MEKSTLIGQLQLVAVHLYAENIIRPGKLLTFADEFAHGASFWIDGLEPADRDEIMIGICRRILHLDHARNGSRNP